MTQIAFFVFSYNKGPLLDNCVDSIERCAPGAPVTVVDDRSDDASTVEVLEALATRHCVIEGLGSSPHKHGGLYENMQLALDVAGHNDLVCFIQDDTQVVRPLAAADESQLAAYFEDNPDLGFVRPTFLKGVARARGRETAFRFDERSGLYFPLPDGRSAGINYSDVFLASAARLRSAGWQFQRGEPANQARAAQRFGPMGYLRAPFVMWLPNCRAFRGRRKTWTLAMAERARACGIYPFRPMSSEEVHALEATRPEGPPVAEDHLTTIGASPPKPWIYDPLHGSRWLKHLNRLELAARRIIE